MIYALLALLFALAAVAFLLYRARNGAPGDEAAGRSGASPSPQRASVPAEALRLTQLEITIAGDSLGRYSDWTAALQPDGRVKVTVKSQPTHSDRCKTKTRTRDAGVMAQLEQVFVDANMMSWPRQPQSEIFALDAATTSVSFTFDGKAGRFSSDQVYPEDGRHTLVLLREIMEAAVQ